SGSAPPCRDLQPGDHGPQRGRPQRADRQVWGSGRRAVRTALLLCVLLAGPGLAAAAARRATLLVPRRAPEHPPRTREIDAYRFDLSAGDRRLVEVEQDGVDVELTALWQGGLTRVDSPLDRDGLEILLVPPQAMGTVRVEVRGLVSEGRPGRLGRYRIR